MAKGIVIKSTGSVYTVRDTLCGQLVECRMKGRIRLQNLRTTNPVAVGDEVEYETDATGAACVIASIYARRNYIIRRASNLSKESHIIASNLDHAYLVATIDFPPTNFEFIDRFLVTAEAYNVPCTLLLNKIDLYDDTEEHRQANAYFHHTYATAGYRIVETSCVTGAGIDALRNEMQGRTSLFTGNSGVGKSSLIAAVDPTVQLRTGAISSAHNRGKHTTTFAEMYPLGAGGYVIDTPGIKGFGLIDIAPDELPRYFPDLMRYAPQCQYYNCTHTHEPGCAVKEALEAGEVSESRYISYLKLIDDGGKYRR